ncbi:MAG: protein-L-isoaspartate(D-aspartate) O-methyltransferase [Victivallales bacterium]
MKERKDMVRFQIENRGVKNPDVLRAMRKVPRHKFLPENLIGQAYCDYPLPVGYGQTISQPYIVALMTELLAPRPGHRILEVGTGSGYQAAVLAEIVGEVYTVEIIEPLFREAERRLKPYKNIHCRLFDGANGWPEEAPFDGIVTTAAAAAIPETLVSQLKTGGRMVIPVGGANEVQILYVVEKTTEGTKITPNIPVRFVPMTGLLRNI